MIGRSLKVATQLSLAVLPLLAGRALAVPPYLDEAGIRAAIIGHTLDGHYGNGVTWAETYTTEGRLDYRERERSAAGAWSFNPGDVFCTWYDPGPFPALTGGCWLVLKSSANCFEFYLADDRTPLEPPEEGEPQAIRWNAQGWRRGEPSTCGERPIV